jgi:acetyl esterase
MSRQMSVSALDKSGDIEPEIRAFVEKTSADFAALAGDRPVTPERRREIAELVRAPWREGGPEMASTENITIGAGGLRARIHVPPNGPGDGTLLYLHGGGWTIFSIDTHDRLMREYAARAGCGVIGLDYSLSPESRFPAALGDVDACITWLRSEGRRHNLNVSRLVIGGDSAGANLSLCTALRMRDRGDALPDGLLLNYAALDTVIRPSYAQYDGDPYMLGTSEMKAFWSDYLGAPDTDNPNARPLLADLAGLPPVHLCIAECDILRDENLELKSRLMDAQTPVSAIVYPGATHSFLEAVSISATAAQAMADSSAWLAARLKP